MERTENVVDFMVTAFCADADERKKYYFKAALFSLVQMAKAEQVLEIQQDLDQVNQVIAKTQTKTSQSKPRH